MKIVRRLKSLLVVLITCGTIALGQQSVGLISYDAARSMDGYNLIYPHNQPNVYLFNNCGEIVHTWKDSTIWRPGNTAYLTKEGKLIKTKRNKTVTGNPIWYGGGGAIVEIRDWDNQLQWTFEVNDSLHRLHHDIAPMPNGNILMIVWHKKVLDELIAAGRDTTRFKEKELAADYLIEVNPTTNQIVWQWNMWDHLIQDHDSTKANFGVVADHPEKININYPSLSEGSSWLHTNAIDYNAELDQILISVPTYNEIWIIDHSTTTLEAAGNAGGLSGKGGELMYRWGNPATYNKQDVFSQKLYFQHDAHWIKDFIAPNHPNFGKIAVFNNRAGTDYSTVNFFTPPWDMYEWRYTKTMGAWGPSAADFTAGHPTPPKLYSSGLSSVQLLPNDNLLILSGRNGYAFELTPDQKIVWEYTVPLKNGFPVNQGAVLMSNDNTTFRMKRYPKTYSAFEGKDLSPKGYLELNPDPLYCTKLVSNEDVFKATDIKIFPNPAQDYLTIETAKPDVVRIIRSDGKTFWTENLLQGRRTLDVSAWGNGLYYIWYGDHLVKAFNIIK